MSDVWRSSVRYYSLFLTDITGRECVVFSEAIDAITQDDEGRAVLVLRSGGEPLRVTHPYGEVAKALRLDRGQQ